MTPGLSGLQRLLASAGCLAAAAILHIMLCEWAIRPVSDLPSRHLVTYTYEKTANNLTATMARGILTDEGIDRAMAITFGLAAPVMLAAAALAILAGWRRTRRIENGWCLRCGYDLNGGVQSSNTAAADTHSGCPECGWRRHAAAS